MLRSRILRLQHLVSCNLSDLAILDSGTVRLLGTTSGKECTVTGKYTFNKATPQNIHIWEYPMNARIAQLLPGMRCGISEQLGSYRCLVVSPRLPESRGLHVSTLLRQQGVMQRPLAWGGRPSPAGASRTAAASGPPRRHPNKRRRGPITERRMMPRNSFGTGANKRLSSCALPCSACILCSAFCH